MRRNSGLFLLLAATGLAPRSIAVALPSVGAFADPQATSCSIVQSGEGPGRLYLLCVLGGRAAGGILSAEFRIAGFPSTWYASVIPNPAESSLIGNPLLGGGTINFFPTCQSGTDGIVLLYTIDYWASGPDASGTLTVHHVDYRFHPDFQCPLLTLCEGPPLVKICASASVAIINGPACTVGAARTTWTRVKSMYD